MRKSFVPIVIVVTLIAASLIVAHGYDGSAASQSAHIGVSAKLNAVVGRK